MTPVKEPENTLQIGTCGPRLFLPVRCRLSEIHRVMSGPLGAAWDTSYPPLRPGSLLLHLHLPVGTSVAECYEESTKQTFPELRFTLANRPACAWHCTSRTLNTDNCLGLLNHPKEQCSEQLGKAPRTTLWVCRSPFTRLLSSVPSRESEWPPVPCLCPDAPPSPAVSSRPSGM